MAEIQDSLITDEMRAAIGKRSDPTTYEIDKTSVRMFARAVGYTDPVFYDEAEAKKAGYRSLPAPPGYLGTPVFDPNRSGGGRGPTNLEPARPLKRVLNGGTVVDYQGDICAGDVLTGQSFLADVNERVGSIGHMLIVTTKTEYTNQNGELVATMTGTGIRY